MAFVHPVRTIAEDSLPNTLRTVGWKIEAIVGKLELYVFSANDFPFSSLYVERDPHLVRLRIRATDDEL